MTMDRNKMIEFKQNGDDRGKLVVVEGMKDIPFDIKRIFYIYGSDTTVVRGQHANRRSEFVLINVCGSSKVRVRDGKKDEVFVLDKPHTGIYLPKMLWKDMYDFSEDSILLCLASEAYDSSEYIRDFDEYIKEVNKNG
ncbi:dTDP-4-dehydrorhamnose 3,5-epimerase [Clostridium saccharoperbutylacetonicum N1-4(HMT)]|uniref:dTDP-4-dehydrorhamnose 3,5-epimerase n=2 Tax=Clostridium saccharoperbutylacetonicum TaxID=36745 RepID=M1N6Z8_9CLOT|nr:dTDP-4-dehydrorhamnose 3,5-epimerase [Clostridium saccharoperbutylacetonicum N1-4(HMT)]